MLTANEYFIVGIVCHVFVHDDSGNVWLVVMMVKKTIQLPPRINPRQDPTTQVKSFDCGFP
jgi:hypothetical protein